MGSFVYMYVSGFYAIVPRAREKLTNLLVLLSQHLLVKMQARVTVSSVRIRPHPVIVRAMKVRILVGRGIRVTEIWTFLGQLKQEYQKTASA